ncbi:MAG: hypothetical protein AAF719_01155 [Pseudomonadota bacterium]
MAAALDPVLLTEAEAKELLGNINPREIAAPVRFGRGYRWYKPVLIQALNRIFEVDTPAEQVPKSEWDAWEAENGENAA